MEFVFVLLEVIMLVTHVNHAQETAKLAMEQDNVFSVNLDLFFYPTEPVLHHAQLKLTTTDTAVHDAPTTVQPVLDPRHVNLAPTEPFSTTVFASLHALTEL